MRLGEELSGFNSLNLRDLMKEQDQDEIKEVNDEDVSQRQRQTIGSILGGLVSAKEEEEDKTEGRATLWEVLQSEQSEKPKEFSSGGILKNVRRLVARKKDEIKELEEFEDEEETLRLLQSWGNNRSPRSPTIVDSARAVIDSDRLLQEEEGERLEGAVRVFLVGGSSHGTDRQMMDRPRWRALRHKLRLRKFACCGSSWSAARSNLSSATPVVLPQRDDDDDDKNSWSGSGHRIDPNRHQNNNISNINSSIDGDDSDAETCTMAEPEAAGIGETPTRVNFIAPSYHPDTESAETSSFIGARFSFGSLYRGGQTESAETQMSTRNTFSLNSPYHPETGVQTQTASQVSDQPRRERREQLITLLERTLEPEAAERQETRGGMNLAAALAAERQLRAAQEQEAMAPAGVSRVSNLGNHPQILTDFRADMENREGSRSPFRVSLMTLLEEADDHNGTAVPVLLEEWDPKDEVAADNGGLVDDSLCCVCMVRRKGAAYIPCGHTFCRLCTRELWVSRGSCPLCNRCIVEILDIF